MNSQNELNSSQTMQYGTIFSAESIKVMAESAGYNALSDDAAKELAEDVSFKVKRTVQDALKFMKHSRRERLSTVDIDAALRVRNLAPQFGFANKDFVPFRFASGGGRELHFNDEHEIELNDAMPNALNFKLPLDISLRAHWLAVDGIQPLIPENPPPSSKDEQALESVNPVVKLEQGITKETAGKPIAGKIHKYRNVEPVHVKQLATHELSVEQQLYYKQITEACVGSDESRRGEALQSLSADPGLHEMLPRMCTFIAEGVKVNVVQNNLALLIYLMRMVKALLDNPALYLEKYLHELIPSVNTCIVSRQLCMRPELDNHWALRDFASRLMAQMCKNFNTPTNNLQTRVTRIFSKSLTNDKTHLSSLYGSLAGLAELGGEVVKVIIIPRLRFISDRIESLLLGTSQSNTDKTAAGHIRSLLQKNCPPIIRQIRSAPDLVEDYRNDYGFLGPSFCTAVIKLRNTPAPPSSTSSTPISSGPITSAAQSATGRPSQIPARQTGPLPASIPRIIQPSPNPPKYLVVSQPLQQSVNSQQTLTQHQQPAIKRMRTSSPTSTITTPTSPQASLITTTINATTIAITSTTLAAASSSSNNNLNNLTNISLTNNISSSKIKHNNNCHHNIIVNNTITIDDSIDRCVVSTSNNDIVNPSLLQARESVLEDVEMVIVESEVRPPPELDDLSHLE